MNDKLKQNNLISLDGIESAKEAESVILEFIREKIVSLEQIRLYLGVDDSNNGGSNNQAARYVFSDSKTKATVESIPMVQEALKNICRKDRLRELKKVVEIIKSYKKGELNETQIIAPLIEVQGVTGLKMEKGYQLDSVLKILGHLIKDLEPEQEQQVSPKAEKPTWPAGKEGDKEVVSGFIKEVVGLYKSGQIDFSVDDFDKLRALALNAALPKMAASLDVLKVNKSKKTRSKVEKALKTKKPDQVFLISDEEVGAYSTFGGFVMDEKAAEADDLGDSNKQNIDSALGDIEETLETDHSISIFGGREEEIQFTKDQNDGEEPITMNKDYETTKKGSETIKDFIGGFEDGKTKEPLPAFRKISSNGAQVLAGADIPEDEDDQSKKWRPKKQD